ncbi:hypothetical protein E5083_21640 [Streptomyces bauhiniae]|uniref:Uncharacterized protein n=1 Tax=Streptomyces bauhiniae TaxID=2340725 RepID=A0A4Z1D0P0_9ACTN|nr:hypothetical protein E5083_21640 [Streptomyces bauhiniae]
MLLGVVGEAELLRRASGARVVSLGQGMGLLPDATGVVSEAELGAWSALGAVARVEAEYFGGLGEQWATVWEGGEVVLGPLHLPEGEELPAEGSPISRALRRLGVVAGAGEDEFSAVGLGRHRATEDWLN